MKSFFVIALCVASVLAVGNAAPAEIQTIQAQFTPLFTQLGKDAQNGDLSSASKTLQKTNDLSNVLISQSNDQNVIAFLNGLKSKVEPQLKKINAGESSKEDLQNFVGDISLALREVGGWAAGTAVGLADAAAQGVGGAIQGAKNGLKNGSLLKAVTGAVSGGGHGVTTGALKGFGDTLGGIIQG